MLISLVQIGCIYAAPGPRHDQDRTALKVRESPVIGPYVQGVTKMCMVNPEAILGLIEQGNENRKTGATQMNATSSRSHAMLVLNVCERFMNGEDDDVEHEDSDLERTSRLNLVDLAGSERQGKTKAKGDRLKEGIAINKSLCATFDSGV